MFNFLKKRNDSLPPDIGKEESDVVTEVTPDDVPVYDDSASDKNNQSPSKITGNFRNNMTSGDETTKLEFEKIHSRIEGINEFIKGFNERFSIMNQQIGEVRTMALTIEKEISKSGLEAQKVVDIVKEVEPDKLRLDYQKSEAKVNTLSEKLDSNKQFMDSIMEELKDLKRKARLFEGTDALLKLNEDVKKDLIELQKMSSRVRVNTDKSEQIFIEFRKAATENEKNNKTISNLDNIYSEIKQELERLKIDRQKSINYEDYNSFKKKIEDKIFLIESAFSDLDKTKKDYTKLNRVIEDLLAIEKRNENDIINIRTDIKDENEKRMNDYESRLLSVLDLSDNIASEMKKIKQKIDVISDNHVNKNVQVEQVCDKEIKIKYETFNQRIENERKINDLLLDGGYSLVKKDSLNAVKIYNEVIQIYNPLWDKSKNTYYKITKFRDNIISLGNANNVNQEIKKEPQKVISFERNNKYNDNNPNNSYDENNPYDNASYDN